ncbi:MAG: hypothetical protein WDZ70_01630 [Candidatus Paceibacterota bacterium]
MQQAKIGMHAMLFGVVLLWLHMTALRLHWYWHMPWFDVLPHFIGGMFAAFSLIFISFLYYRSQGKETERAFSAAIILFGTFLVGILWEIFEYIFAVSVDPLASFDTVVDLFMDTLGALVVWWYVQKGRLDKEKKI